MLERSEGIPITYSPLKLFFKYYKKSNSRTFQHDIIKQIIGETKCKLQVKYCLCKVRANDKKTLQI